MQRILGIIGWAGTAIVLAAVAVRLFKPEWAQYAVWGAWTGLVLVLLYTIGQWRDIAATFKRRQARYGTLATFSVLIVLLILIAVNYLSARENKRWDLTANRQFSLSDQTVKLLRNLDAPAKFIAFDRPAALDRFRDRLEEYKYHSSKVDVEYVDPDTKPVLAKQYQIQQYGTVVITYKDRVERVTSDSEQDLTNALIKAISGKQLTVYFVQGHGEKDPTGTDRNGYSAVAGALQHDNYKVEKLTLAQQKDVPADATVVVIAGPTSDLLPVELDSLKRYLAKGGKLMLLVDPAVGREVQPLSNLHQLAKDWGIDIGNNVVIDVSGASTDPSLAVANNYPTHAITERFDTLTIFPLARSVQPISGGSNGHFAQSIVETSPQSWAETSLADVAAGKNLALDEAKGDKKGPVTVAAAVSAGATEATPSTQPAKNGGTPAKPETRVVVFGDADFPSNAFAGIVGNRNLMANAVNWLAQQENLISIRPREAADRRLTLTANQKRGVMWLTIFVPLVVFGTGVYSWWRRR